MKAKLKGAKMDFILTLTLQSVQQVLLSLQHNWPYLLASILIAAALKLYLDEEKVSTFLKRNRNASVLAATTAAVATPLCSCGTTAVVLGMMASLVPWAPIIAFMVASQLTSPQELFYSAGLFGWPFALTFFTASIVLGLAGGAVGATLDRRGWLKNQTRMVTPCTTCVSLPVVETSTCGCNGSEPVKPRIQLKDYLNAVLVSGKQLLLMFTGFAFIGFFLNGLIPAEWVSAFFGSGNSYSVPLAATLGLPFYISSEASLPLIRALLEAGMSQGAAMAFLISGSGTSVGAVAGALTIARWRVITVVVSVLWIGAIAFGYIFDLLKVMGIS
jgi:uncharacterized membrane protein YraQ (UPF0718 family)